MVLINCPECGTEVSDRASACPRCGHPLLTAPPAPAVSERTKLLDRKLIEAAAMARQRGGTMIIDSRSDTEALFTYVQPPNHVLHGILTVLTAGIWLIVWLVIAASGGKKETWRIVIDESCVAHVGQI